MPFTEQQRGVLLRTARQSIEEGVRLGRPLQVKPQAYEPPLCDNGASFVTLQWAGQLRGCIGSLEARRPLILDVAENAYAAAFLDSRFQRLQEYELGGLSIEISVLSAPQVLPVTSERQLLEQVRPNVDGLIIEDGVHRGTFLPSVWASLPDPADFIRHLKLKAGLPADHWSDKTRVWRYATEHFSEQDGGAVTSC